MSENNDLIDKLNEVPGEYDSSNPDDSLLVTDIPVDQEGSTFIKGSSGTQIKRPAPSLSGIHKELRDYLKEPRRNLDSLEDEYDILDTLPFYAMLENQSPLILEPDKNKIYALLALSISDDNSDWPKDEETVRQEIRDCQHLRDLVDKIYMRESELRDTIGQKHKYI